MRKGSYAVICIKIPLNTEHLNIICSPVSKCTADVTFALPLQ